MSVNRAELALAAGRTRELGEQLSDVGRDQIIREWADLLDALETARPGTGELALIAYRARIEERLASKLAHTPLEVVAR